MASLRTKIRYWEKRETKLSSSIGWRGAWRNPCTHFRVDTEQQNGGPQKNGPWQKMKTPPEGQTSNRRWIKPSRYGKDMKASP